jgi:hypothetical protein
VWQAERFSPFLSAALEPADKKGLKNWANNQVYFTQTARLFRTFFYFSPAAEDFYGCLRVICTPSKPLQRLTNAETRHRNQAVKF